MGGIHAVGPVFSWKGLENPSPATIERAMSAKSLSGAACQPYAEVIDIMQTHLGAGTAVVQPFFFCASNHSTEPGWGTD